MKSIYLWFALLSAASIGCNTSLDVSVQLVAACTDQSVLAQGNCEWVRLLVWSKDADDPLYPYQGKDPVALDKAGTGPFVRECAYGASSCEVQGSELLGLDRMVYVQCFVGNPREVPPFSHGSSLSFALEDVDGGAGGTTINMLMGQVSSMVGTTSLSQASQAPIGQCTTMGEPDGRYGHASVLLRDGRVLTTGGIQPKPQLEEFLRTAEIYDPRTGLHALVVGPDGEVSMKAPSGRAYHTMTLLDDGTVLIAGGVALVNGALSSLRSAEIFDPRTSFFTSTNSDMGTGGARAYHTATRLANGKVLIAGGAVYDRGNLVNYLDTAEIYDPATRTFTRVATKMRSARGMHQAVDLPLGGSGVADQKIALFGGENQDGVLNTMDIFSAADLKFLESATPVMNVARTHFCAVPLDNGRVMLAGGSTVRDNPATPGTFDYDVTKSVEVYDPFAASGAGTGSFVQAGLLESARMMHTCSRLSDGSVVIAGGLSGGSIATQAVETFTAKGSVFTLRKLDSSFAKPRFRHTAVTLENGWVLLTGGATTLNPTVPAEAQSYLFVPPPADWSRTWPR